MYMLQAGQCGNEKVRKKTVRFKKCWPQSTKNKCSKWVSECKLNLTSACLQTKETLKTCTIWKVSSNHFAGKNNISSYLSVYWKSPTLLWQSLHTATRLYNSVFNPFDSTTMVICRLVFMACCLKTKWIHKNTWPCWNQLVADHGLKFLMNHPIDESLSFMVPWRSICT